MLKKLIHKIKWWVNPPRLAIDTRNNYLNEAELIAKKIPEILSILPNTTLISLGENCNSAWYIKAVGSKKHSYPFDWIYCSPKIITHCIQDSFRIFLDKTFIFSTRSGNSAGHRLYHNSMFNHRNPLKKEKDFQYYERCVSRFLEILQQQKPIVFVMTVIAEHQKRSGSGWAKGFNNEFPLPLHQKMEDMVELQNSIRAINPNCQFVFMEHYTEKNPKIELVDFKKGDFVWIRHTSFQRNTGVFFKDKTDDTIAKVLYNSLKV